MQRLIASQNNTGPSMRKGLLAAGGLENILSKAKNFWNRLKAAIPLASATIAPFLASQPALAQSNSEAWTNGPIVFWAESRQTNGKNTRHFNKNAGSAGQGMRLIVYADNTLSSNIVGGIEFNLNYPTNNIDFLYSINPNPYVQGSVIHQTHDLFFQAPMSQVNETGLLTRRFVSQGTQPSQLINQSNK